MPKQKYDFKALKTKFMDSEHIEVKAFLESQWLPYNRFTREKAKGRGREKKELIAESSDKAIQRVWNKMVNKLEPSTEFLLWNITKAIELSGRKLEQMEEKDQINVKDLNTIRWMNRIQNWQPTTYVKEDQNVNQNVSIAWIHIVLWPDYIDDNKWDKI